MPLARAGPDTIDSIRTALMETDRSNESVSPPSFSGGNIVSSH